MLILVTHSIHSVKSHDTETFEYAQVTPETVWKNDMAKELIEVWDDQASIENVYSDKLEEILEHLCIS